MGKTLQTNDGRLTAFKNNDQKVMQQVYQSIFPKFRGHVLKNSGNESRAKDVFQEAFITCWRNIKENKLKENSNVEAYLFTIAKNKWIDHLRSSTFRKTVTTDSFSNLSVVSEDTETDKDRETQFAILQTALKQLKDGCRSLLQLFYFERKSMEEISKTMNLTSASARNQKYRCMEKLRALSLQVKHNG